MYGSVIGGFFVGIVYLYCFCLFVLVIVDLIVLGMLIGLLLGWIGCLMNGCCYGGVCDWFVVLCFLVGLIFYMVYYIEGCLIGIEGEICEGDLWIMVDLVKVELMVVNNGVEKGDWICFGGV